MNKKPWLVTTLVLLLALSLLAGCGRRDQPAEQTSSEERAEETTEAAQIDPATAATVSGKVNFQGTAPKAARLDMSQDPQCRGTNTAETMSVNGGKLANVFVYVKDGLDNRSFPAPKEPVVLDQKGCRYVPHVLGVMTGQTVRILNSDPTTHNIHPTPQNNREWNESQPPNGAPLEKTFAREEIMLPVKCNQHPWMKMYVSVVKHPFFAVTDEDGDFELKGLPPGDYTIAAVHEKLGEKTQKVTVAAKDSKTVDFNFGGSAGGGAQ
jgi:plastocyanin